MSINQRHVIRVDPEQLGPQTLPRTDENSLQNGAVGRVPVKLKQRSQLNSRGRRPSLIDDLLAPHVQLPKLIDLPQLTNQPKGSQYDSTWQQLTTKNSFQNYQKSLQAMNSTSTAVGGGISPSKSIPGGNTKGFQDTNRQFQVLEQISNVFPNSTKLNKNIKMQRYMRSVHDEKVSRSVAAYPSPSFVAKNKYDQSNLDSTRNDLRKEIEKRRGMSINIQKNMIKNTLGAAQAAGSAQRTPQKNLIDFSEVQVLDESGMNQYSLNSTFRDSAEKTTPPPIANSCAKPSPLFPNKKAVILGSLPPSPLNVHDPKSQGIAATNRMVGQTERTDDDSLDMYSKLHDSFDASMMTQHGQTHFSKNFNYSPNRSRFSRPDASRFKFQSIQKQRNVSKVTGGRTSGAKDAPRYGPDGVPNYSKDEIYGMVRDINERNRRKYAQIRREVEIQNSVDTVAKRSENIFQVSNTKRHESQYRRSNDYLGQRNQGQKNVDDFSAQNSISAKESMVEMSKILVTDQQQMTPMLNYKETGSLDVQEQAQQTYRDLDERILERREREKRNTRQFWQEIICGMNASEESLFDDPATGRIEKRRMRVVSEFEQQIQLKKKKLKEASEYLFLNQDPEVRVSKIFQSLNGNNRDPEVNKALEEIQPQTARFLADLIGDVMTQTEKNKIVQKLSVQLDSLIDSKLKYDQKMKSKLMGASQEHLQKLLLDGLQELAKQARAHAALKQREEIGLPGRKGKEIKLPRGDTFSGCSDKKTNKMQSFVKKNFHEIVHKKLKLGFMTKILNMHKQVEKIFGTCTLDQLYLRLNANLWQNEYYRNRDMQLSQHLKLQDFNMLYTKEVQTQRFYTHLEKPHLCDDQQPEMKTSLQFSTTLAKAFQLSLPTFARINSNQLFLSELNVTKEMARALSDYLVSMKHSPEAQIRAINFNNIKLRDEQLAQILDALEAQGNYLQTIAYSTGEMGTLSLAPLLKLIPNLHDLHITKLTNSNVKHLVSQVLDSILNEGKNFQRLKLSQINLSDHQICSSLCRVIEERPLLIHLDLSWSKLLPRYLNSIVSTLVSLEQQNLRNLSLAYNSLLQPPQDDGVSFNNDLIDLQASRSFVDNICEFLHKNEQLTHIDLSGMNFNSRQILQIAEAALIHSENLLAIHLSDNNINFDSELRDEILDMMGLSNNIFKNLVDDDFTNNQRIYVPDYFKKAIRMHTLSIVAKDQKNNAMGDANLYTNRLMQTKMGKSVTHQIMKHKLSTIGGVGRIESNLVDEFVLSRWVNRPELVFNQRPYVDQYFGMDAAENWRLMDSACGITGGCPICNKHKYTVIFYEQDQEDPWSFNEDLIEIRDQKVVQKIKEDLNISFRYDKGIAPLIVGTVVTGGFKRKLKMVRADYFAMLSICQSEQTVESLLQIKALKRGMLANLLKSQDLAADDPHVQSLMGWHKQLIMDKCFRNEVDDVLVVNFPAELKSPKASLEDPQRSGSAASPSLESPKKKEESKMKGNKSCSTFVYAAYLPPGNHQFLLYCPKTKRAFCKDIVVALSECEPFPEYPKRYRPPQKPKKLTRQNVWRKWVPDNEYNQRMALFTDMQRPEGYGMMRDKEDQKQCYEMLIERFDVVQVVFMELIAMSASHYPRIAFANFVQSFIANRQDAAEEKKLPRSVVELAYIQSTKIDGTVGIKGMLSRGQFIEITLRLIAQRYPKHKVSEKLPEFMETYFTPLFNQSKILPQRFGIRESRQLNQLLFDNRDGLYQIFLEYSNWPGSGQNGFSHTSATKLLNPLDEDGLDGEQLIPQMQKVFYHSKMTNLKDRENQQEYYHLQYVEFLDFLCRVGIELWKKLGKKADTPVHEMVFELLKKIWDYRAARPAQVPQHCKTSQQKKKEEKTGRDTQEFPELIPATAIDDDE